MTLDQWIRQQPSAAGCGRGSPAARDGRMSDTEFGALVAGHDTAAVSHTTVGLWRRGRRMPNPLYAQRIFEVTGGKVKIVDLRRACGRTP